MARKLFANGFAEAAAAPGHEGGPAGERRSGWIVSRVHLHLLSMSESNPADGDACRDNRPWMRYSENRAGLRAPAPHRAVPRPRWLFYNRL
ncbi:hypothetical protein [Burkholderia cepacia]|uniref:hypothetical protein n=1 Tax=Burkholderia cepacia TaxID=292 RepID=UPI0018AF7AB0|nr:hypothetical protein [Burkholderia cepacia]